MHAWHRADSEAVADEQRRDAEELYLRFSDAPDGTVFVKGKFDSAAGATLRTALEPLAKPQGDDDLRCAERRYADAWVDQAEHALDTGSVPQHGSVRPHVQVTTTLETLQGLIGAPAGEMALSLPISSKTVQRIACDSSITRILLGADSAVIDAGRARRVVSNSTPTLARGSRPDLPLARLRASRLVDSGAPHQASGAGRKDRPVQHDPALPSPSLDGP